MGRSEGCSHQRWDAGTVVNTEFALQRYSWLTHGLIQHHRSIGIGNGAVKGAGRNPEDVPTTVQTNNVKWLLPGQVHELKSAASADRQQIVFLMGMQIKLPGTGF